MGDSLANLMQWFSGNGRYMNLIHCMGHDTFWIVVTVVLDIAVAAGYGLIALHWWKNQRLLHNVPAKRALGNMRNIFLFCGICGYIFIPVKMVWPAWRLYDLFMVVLVYFTWRYAWGAKDLKVVYSELGKSTQLAADLARSREESQRKSFFLNALSHDLRTPLNGLMLHANLAELSVEGNEPAKLRQALADIKLSARATADLLDSLLEYARLDGAGSSSDDATGGHNGEAPLNVSTFTLGDLMTGIAARFASGAAAKGIRLDTASVPAHVRVRTDRLRLERILSNLLDNAIKFTGRGTVRVEAAVVRHSSALELHVIDAGEGIAPEAQGQLFDEFYQVHNHERDRSKGFGLGLAIARRLARQLGGDVQLIDSAPGRGSRFAVVLPAGVVASAADAHPAAAGIVAAPVGAVRGE